MKRLSAIVISLVIFATAFSQIPDSLKYQSLEPYDFHLKYLRADSAVLIDVREYHEFARKRIKGSVNIPSSGNLEFTADTLNKNCILFLYCLNDYRSVRVANLFYDKGFRKLYSLEGGITAWRRDGFKVVRGPGKKRK